MRGLWRRLVDATELTDSQVRTVLAGVALVIAAMITGLVATDAALLWLLTAALVLLVLDRINLVALIDDTRDGTDRAREQADAARSAAAEALALSHDVVHHVTGTDEPSTGRHAHPASPTSPRSPA